MIHKFRCFYFSGCKTNIPFSRRILSTGGELSFYLLPFGLSGCVRTAITSYPSSTSIFKLGIENSGVPMNIIFKSIQLQSSLFFRFSSLIALSINKIPSKWSISWQSAIARSLVPSMVISSPFLFSALTMTFSGFYFSVHPPVCSGTLLFHIEFSFRYYRLGVY